jgi:hypothetical protein
MAAIRILKKVAESLEKYDDLKLTLHINIMDDSGSGPSKLGQ